ncbi:phosphoribosylglycinamide formyltransferase 2 [Haloglomus irregulare]|jgi:phosphoribosylglycinamide formyltransferase 2|uniref:Formate-dependent phosphoribosylglycinamide formyltransferase n=1 Tax=Haloglomus irregulare TaxID=2234134 RepID=A0A554NDL8_9EURY|nr:formate-dependent phosphoribosylglycinamide formyltransferase [Haloglomus irregulare]TSD15405.1 phosphoribosylglycinamide formyltransferase 2 [Haloglomus irregulare]
MRHGTRLGTPRSGNATTLLLLGSGELGAELVSEAQQLGVETVAADRYDGAPAMQVAHRSHVVDMTDGAAVRALVEEESPDLIVPEIEAIATDELQRLEDEGYDVIPTAKATRLTMDREWIREFAAEDVGVPTSDYAFADSRDAYRDAVDHVGLPIVVKPTMSSSGKGQSIVDDRDGIEDAWEAARAGTRSDTGRVIVEELVDFDFEFTLLTVRHEEGTTFCPPVGHRQVDGDYRESWQPCAMSDGALADAQTMAREMTDGLGGYGIFGVEFFVRDGEVLFSELSPRPHDTGLVTLASQPHSEFELHLRAVLGLPVPEVEADAPGASRAIVSEQAVENPAYAGVESALEVPRTELRLFGKPSAYGGRRMGVTVATGEDVTVARERAERAAASVSITDAD